MEVLKGATDVTRYVVLRDSTTGAPETGYTIANLDLQYTRNRTAPAAKVDATALAATDTAHTDNRAIEVDATSSPGLYRIDWPDAAFATGVDKVLLCVSGAGIDPAYEEIPLVNFSLEGQSATDLKDFADDGYDPSTNKVQGVVLTDTVTTYTGNTPQTGDSFARLGAPAGASVSADIAAIEAQTDDIGVAGAGLTALASQASVNTIDDFLDREIAAIKAKTDSLTFTVANKIDANIKSVNDVTVTGVGSEADPWGN